MTVWVMAMLRLVSGWNKGLYVFRGVHVGWIVDDRLWLLVCVVLESSPCCCVMVTKPPNAALDALLP